LRRQLAQNLSKNVTKTLPETDRPVECRSPPEQYERRACRSTPWPTSFLVAAEHHKPDHLLVKEGGAYRPIWTAELADRVRRDVCAAAGMTDVCVPAACGARRPVVQRNPLG